ncbi:MAG: Cof-type HAD-IIB family hydrolase [bacterium]
MTYRLLAVDIDGTLVGDDLSISDATQEALRSCAEQGMVVTLATGRMFQSALPYAQKLGLTAPLITYNGALIKDTGLGTIYHHRTIPLKLAQKVVQVVKELGLKLHTYVDDLYYTDADDEWTRIYEKTAGVKAHIVGDLETFLDREPTKFIISAIPAKLDAMQPLIAAKLAADLYLARSRPFYLELIHPAVSKLEGLKVLGARLKIRLEEMAVIGDSYNDIEMLQAAGLGIAMGNAPEPVQRAADVVTNRVEEEGLAFAVHRFILSSIRR